MKTSEVMKTYDNKENIEENEMNMSTDLNEAKKCKKWKDKNI